MTPQQETSLLNVTPLNWVRGFKKSSIKTHPEPSGFGGILWRGTSSEAARAGFSLSLVTIFLAASLLGFAAPRHKNSPKPLATQATYLACSRFSSWDWVRLDLV